MFENDAEEMFNRVLSGDVSNDEFERWMLRDETKMISGGYTPDQQKMLSEVESEWMQYFYDLKFNKELAIECFEFLITDAGYELPKIVICDSPQECRKLVLERTNYHKYRCNAQRTDMRPSLCGTVAEFTWAPTFDFLNRIGVIKSEKFKNYLRLIKNGTFYAIIMDKICAISRPPIFMKMNDEGRLHCTDGPAIEFSDGYKMFFVDGVRFGPETFQAAFLNHMKPKDIVYALNIRNTEQRGAIIDHYGIDYILGCLNAKIVDTHEAMSIVTGKNTLSRLIEFKVGNDQYRAVDLEDHSTHKRVVRGVPITVDTNTCLGAIAWTFSMSVEEYKESLEVEL